MAGLVREKQLELTVPRTNAEVATVFQGTVVAQHSTAGQVVQASGAADDTLARVFGVVEAAAGIGPGAQGQIITKRGVICPMRFESGLSLAINQRVYVSVATAGEVTNVRPTGAGQVVLEVGRITSVLTYDGGADRLAEVQFVDGERTVIGAMSSSPVILPDGANQTGGALAYGSVVAVDPNGPKRVQGFDATIAGNAEARYVGIVSEPGGIADAATGQVTHSGYVDVLFKTGLTLNDGDEVYGSTTPGEATNLTDLALNPPPSGGVRHRIGVVMDAANYAGQQTALCAVYPGQRLQEP